MIRAKRSLDLLASAIGLIGTAPLMLLLAIATKIDSEGPIFFSVERVGLNGQPFMLRKLRTMQVGLSGPRITSADDPRVTAVGRWLRATKLDELPQLWNVLCGEMSLVGPRPEDPHYVINYSRDERRVLTVRPGLTSPATLLLRDEEGILSRLDGDLDATYRTLVLPAKLALDSEYIVNATLISDLLLLIRTATAIIRRPSLDKQVALVRSLTGGAPPSV